MGGRSEKLLTLEEAARTLGVPPDDLEAMIRSGRLASFRLGGSLLRLRLSDVEALKESLATGGVGMPPWEDPHRAEGPKGGDPRQDPWPAPSSAWDRIRDFFYFNDFYLIAFLIVLGLVVVIVLL